MAAMFDDAREVARQAALRNDELGLIEGQRVDRRRLSPWLVWLGIVLGAIVIVVLVVVR